MLTRAGRSMLLQMVSFDRQIGRVPLHLSGLRGAPNKPSMDGSARPQSALAVLTSSSGVGVLPSRFGKAQRVAPPVSYRNKEMPAKHISCRAWDKQLTREQWTTLPMRQD